LLPKKPLESTDYLHTLITNMTDTYLPLELKDFEDKLDQLINKYHDVKDETVL